MQCFFSPHMVIISVFTLPKPYAESTFVHAASFTEKKSDAGA